MKIWELVLICLELSGYFRKNEPQIVSLYRGNQYLKMPGEFKKYDCDSCIRLIDLTMFYKVIKEIVLFCNE